MTRSRLIVSVIVLFACVVPAFAQLQVPEASLLVLKNGEVFSGRVTWAGDAYYVQTPGRQLTFPKAKVLVVARDMADAYRQRRAALRPTDWPAHQELAAWCLTHQMLDEAARELDDADATSPGHATTARLRTNLAILRRRQAVNPPNVADPAPTTARRDASLESLVEALPEGSVSAFTKTIQPILVNGCAAAACHGVASKSDWRLLRIDARQAASRHATLRNLEATLKLIDRQTPDQSPLLTVPRAPHATAKEAVFNSRNNAQFDQLVAWTHRVAGKQTEQPRLPKLPVAQSSPESQLSASKPSPDPFDPSEFNNSPASRPPASRRINPGGPPPTAPTPPN